MTQFCVISPVAGLQKFSTLTHTHLVLAHVKNALYEEFYRQRAEANELVILDNGAYEGEMNIEELVSRVGVFRPKVVVLPDLFGGETKENYKLGMNFWKQWRSRLPVEWLFIPHCEVNDLRHIMEMEKYIYKAIDEGIKFIGLPRILATRQKDHLLRSHLTRTIKLHNPEVYVHAMGMSAGSLEELHNLQEAKCDSIDSSAPVWRGWNGFDIEDTSWDHEGTPCNFEVHPNTLTRSAVSLIKENLRKVGVNA